MSIDNPIANNYVIELPQLIDKLPSKEEILTLKDEKLASSSCNPEWITDWDGQEWYSIKENEKVNQVISFFNNNHLIKASETWLCMKQENKWVRPHIDTDRLAVLIYPIVPDSYELQFTNKWEGPNDTATYLAGDQDFFGRPYEDTVSYEYNVTHTHTYTCPTLLNSKIPHCLPAKDEKTTFQISFYFGGESCSDWTGILNTFNSGDLITVS
jgi:hypothetical protein